METQEHFVGKAKQCNEKIHAIKSQFSASLDDFQKYYVYYNKNPEVNEFQNYYANSKSQLQNASRDLLSISNYIDTLIAELSKEMSSKSIQLKDEKKINKELTELISNLENTQNGSEILIDDSKKEYNEQYWQNWEIFIGIAFVSLLLGRLFKKPK
jgi:hypothetical protein